MDENEFLTEVETLIKQKIAEIADDYRASDDSEEPSMQLTISTDDQFSGWNYQTGDNSYTGGCYGHPHWAVLYLTRDSDAAELAREAYNELMNLIPDDPQPDVAA